MPQKPLVQDMAAFLKPLMTRLVTSSGFRRRKILNPSRPLLTQTDCAQRLVPGTLPLPGPRHPLPARPRHFPSARPPAPFPCQARGTLSLPGPRHLPSLFTYTASRCSCRNPCSGFVCHVTCNPHHTRPNLLNGNCFCSTSCYALDRPSKP